MIPFSRPGDVSPRFDGASLAPPGQAPLVAGFSSQTLCIVSVLRMLWIVQNVTCDSVRVNS